LGGLKGHPSSTLSVNPYAQAQPNPYFELNFPNPGSTRAWVGQAQVGHRLHGLSGLKSGCAC